MLPVNATPAEDDMVARVRKLCMSLPETSETHSWGHPNFKANGRTFVTIEWVKRRPSIAFRLGTIRVAVLTKSAGYFLTPYGKGLWVSCHADVRLNWRSISRLVQASYRSIANRRMLAALEGMPKRGKKSNAG
jgi:predicted DNA-binding protein (MmcQ/YjbR family)